MLLSDGTIIKGKGFGAPKRVTGESVFNTGMVGYTEALTDPSYGGQILCFTYPLIGNYGVPKYENKDEYGFPKYFESNKIQARGTIIHELCEKPSHWASAKNLNEWLLEEDIPGICDVDTRFLTQKIRTHGVMMSILETSEKPIDISELKNSLQETKTYEQMNLVEEVTDRNFNTIGNQYHNTIVVIDCGIKNGILRNLVKKGFKVVRVRYDTPIKDIISHKPVGIVVSNGPGDPKTCSSTIKTIKEIIEMNIPLLGICLGHQLIALALEGDTYKMKYGHRGQNKACIEIPSNRSYITSQNHGYSVDEKSIEGIGLKKWFVNADDNTIEGMKHENKSCLAVQFHPEATPGPYDTEFIFDEFRSMILKEVKL